MRVPFVSSPLRRVIPALAAVALTAAVAPELAQAGDPPVHEHLSTRLDAIASPALRGASDGDQAAAVSLAPSGPGSLVRDADGLVVEIQLDSDATAHLDALRQAGATILAISTDRLTVSASVDENHLASIGEVDGVIIVREVQQPFTSGSARRAVTCPGGSVVDEGDAQLNAATARANYNVNGSGVTVGVISDSYGKTAAPSPNGAATDVSTGDLPGVGNPCTRTDPVNVLADAPTGGTDEGRAMTQIVHDLAPGAKLAFATANPSPTAFANNIGALRTSAGAKVIVDDVVYFNEPFFQDGPIANAVNAADAAGVSYYSAVGNFNVFDSTSHQIGSFESPAFRPAVAQCPVAGTPKCEDFDSTAGEDQTLRMTVPTGSTFSAILDWAEPVNGVTTDFDLYAYNTAGTLLGSSTNANIGIGGYPNEALQIPNSTGAALPVDIVLRRTTQSATDPTPRFKLIFNGISAQEYNTSTGGDVVGPTIFGHAAAAGANGVAAVRFNNNSFLENFSGRGPVTKYFAPVNGNAVAATLGTPVVRATPDIAATNGSSNTFFGQAFGDANPFHFFGTSAAAPHAAAVAALAFQRRPTATPTEIRNAVATGARAVGASGAQAGAGLIDANAAVGSLVSTAVRWRGGTARALGERGVRVTWATARETDLLGFQVLRAHRGSARRVLVTKKLVLGGSLALRKARAGSYAVTDARGRSGDRYYVVERSVGGKRTVHGPLVARR